MVGVSAEIWFSRPMKKGVALYRIWALPATLSAMSEKEWNEKIFQPR